MKYIILGKPGCGKTTLAKRLSELTDTVLISPGTIPIEENYLAELRQGKLVTDEVVSELMIKELDKPHVNYKGYTFDSLSEDQIEKLDSESAYLIYLKISDSDLIKRRAAQWIDPVTLERYSGQQVLYSRQKLAQGLEPPKPVETTEEEGEEKEAEAEEVIEETEERILELEMIQQSQSKKRVPLPPYNYQNNPEWTVMKEEVLDRLIKDPADNPTLEFALSDLKESTKQKFLHRIIELDATLTANSVFEQLKSRLEMLPFVNKPIQPIRMVPAEGEADLFKYYQTLNVTEFEPTRDYSDFQQFCPVSLYKQGFMVQGSLQFVALYKGYLYAFASEEYLNDFIQNPTLYLNGPFKPKFNMAVIGGPKSGKTYHAKKLAETYQLKYISLQDFYTILDSDNCPEELSELSGKYRRGLDVTLESLRYTTQSTQGWVLDGFPINTQQAAMLIEANVIPKYLIGLLNTENETRGTKGDYSETFNTVKDYLKSFDVIPLSISSDASKAVVFRDISLQMDPFVPKATVFTPSPEREAFDGELGATKDYCPVACKSRRILTKGDKGLGVKYKGKMYYMSNEDAKKQFLSNPQEYIDADIPPSRFILWGTKGSGKSTILTSLSEKTNLPIIDYREYLVNFGKNHPEHQESIDAVLKGTVLAPEVLKLVLTELFSTGFLLKNFPITKSDLDVMFKEKFTPDAFINLKIESDAAAKRIFKRERRVLDEEKAKDEANPKVVVEGAEEPPRPRYLMTDEELLAELILAIDKQSMEISEYLTTVEGVGMPAIDISTAPPVRPVLGQLYRKLRPFIEWRESILTAARPIQPEEATLYLSSGRKSLGPLGLYCPVSYTWYFQPGKYGTKPVCVGDTIYYCKDDYTLKEFLRNPIKYTTKEIKPRLSPRVCVFGIPKAGTSTLAEKLALDTDSVHLTVSKIVQSIVDGEELTDLSADIKASIAKDEPLGQEIIISAINTVLKRIQEAGRGWVLEGFPSTLEQAKSLEAAGCFGQFFFLNMNDEAYVKRLQQLNEDLIVSLKQAQVLRAEASKIQDYFSPLYANYYSLDASSSKWYIKETVERTVGNCLDAKKNYLYLVSQGKPAPVENAGLNHDIILANLSKFDAYDPVILTDNEELEKVDLSSCLFVEYQSKFVALKSHSQLQSFISDPKKYYERDLPALPQIVTSTLETVALQGYCPVTFSKGNKKDFSSMVPGQSNLLVQYMGQVYRFASEAYLKEFLKTPWKYNQLQLPSKLPPPIVPIPLSGLPTIGYLEQTVASSLTNALVAVGKFKPKYPTKNLQDSACEFIGLHLKANNKQKKDWIRKSYDKKLEEFKHICSLTKDLVNIPKEYVPPESRDPWMRSSLGVLTRK